MQHHRQSLAVLLVATLTLFTAACASGPPRRTTPYDDALRQVHLRGGTLAWGGVEVGMTFAQVERALGQRLPVPDGPGELCGDYHLLTDVRGQQISLTFRGPTQSARLRDVGVRLPAGFDMDAVVDALRARLGDMEWVPSRHQPRAREHELRNRLYRVGEAGVVFLNPDGGFQMGDVCID
ncbi:MAG TPA: hypothetical protein VKU40_05770 [Thermoanaerobaculia bacterium]|nr:hypothetical protein [Thermoanaerobaculia bacterium]